MILVFLILTLIACGYAIYCNRQLDNDRYLIQDLIYRLYKPDSPEEFDYVVERMIDELDRIEKPDYLKRP